MKHYVALGVLLVTGLMMAIDHKKSMSLAASGNKICRKSNKSSYGRSKNIPSHSRKISDMPDKAGNKALYEKKQVAKRQEYKLQLMRKTY